MEPSRILFLCYTDQHGYSACRAPDGERFVCLLAGRVPTSPGWVKLSKCRLHYSPNHTSHTCLAARVAGRGPANRPSPAKSVFVTSHNGSKMISDGGRPLMLRVCGRGGVGVMQCLNDNAARAKLHSLLRDYDADYIYSDAPLDLPEGLLSEQRISQRVEDSGGGGAERSHAKFVASIREQGV